MPIRALLSWFGLARARPGDDHESILRAGIAQFESGDLVAAAHAFTQVLERAPEHPRALHLLGVVRLSNGDAPAAENLLRKAVAIDPAPHLFWFNLGNALAAQSQPGPAADAFRKCLERAPDHAASIVNLVRACEETQDFDGAVTAATQLCRLDAADSARAELGMAMYRRGAATAGQADLVAAIEILGPLAASPVLGRSQLHNVRLFLGDSLTRLGRAGEALTVLEDEFGADPEDIETTVQLANCLNGLGRIRDAGVLYERVVDRAPGNLPAISSAISAADYDWRLAPQENTQRRFRLMRAFADPARCVDWPNPPSPDRRLKLGYVSPDFRDHVAMTLFEEVLARHDHDRFEVFAYDAAAQRDERNLKLRRHADHWREIDAIDTAAAVRRIRDDNIDVLVDLAGHTAGNRLMVFARKPAPVQATWLGYPGSTGLPEIDYIVSDPFTTPPKCDKFYSERVWRLPATRFCFAPPRESPQPALPDVAAAPTFGCFNNLSKINPAVLELWGRILRAVPQSRLLLKYHSLDGPSGRQRLMREVETAGIDPARVEMRGWSGYLDTLAQYRDVHVALDPFPFCGGLTSLDALWMGVPVLTLDAQLMAGRQTAAFLAILEHPELIAEDQDSYLRMAVELAQDAGRLAGYRSGLRDAMRNSPMLAYESFTRDLEHAWRGMWRHWCDARAAI